MGKSRTAGRKLDPIRVQMAQRTQLAKHELAMTMVAERVKTDAEFAADVLKIAGEGLRPEIRKDAETTIAKAKTQVVGELDGVPIMSNLPYNEPGTEQTSCGLYVVKHDSLPESMKAVPVNVPIEVVDVPKEQLQAALTKLSDQQAERLKEAGLA